MKRTCLLLLPVLLASALAAAEPAPEASKLPPLWRAIDTKGMNTARKPWVDFYDYANGKWIANNEIPADKARVYVFTLLDDQNQRVLRQILEDAAADRKAAPDSIRGKVGAFYRSGMDTASIEKAGAKPLQKELGRIAALADRAALMGELARLHLLGANAAFRFGPTADAKDSTRTIGALYQGGLGLPDRDYYLKDDPRFKKLRAAYLDHLGKMFVLLGEKSGKAGKDAQTVLDFETRLAKASRARVDLRDPHRNYNPMTVAELEKAAPGADWPAYFQALGIAGPKKLNVGQPAFIEAVAGMIKEAPLAAWRTYLRWRLLDAYADKLSEPFVKEDFHFGGTVLSGTPRNQPRWQRVVRSTDSLLGEALGQLYVARAFPPEAKAKADALVQNIKATLRERLAGLDWMSPQTRKEAVKKLDAIRVKIGYPSKWRDYRKLNLASDVYAENVMAATRFGVRYRLDKIGKPVDRDQWGMTPPTVNAYYNPSLNEIVFPAGILQPPFFDPRADDAVNYGGIGMVIGHELTHGFDDQGRKFDAAGNLRDWWTAQDAKKYKERADQIARQYGNFVAVDDLKVNGALTLGENIADLGGLKIAYLALQKTLKGKPEKKIDAFTPEQRYFLAFAQIWRGLQRPEALRQRLLTDPHSPAKFRVLGPLYNMPEFFQAFGVTPQEARGRVNPKPVVIW
jgi:putative endopeptidase